MDEDFYEEESGNTKNMICIILIILILCLNGFILYNKYFKVNNEIGEKTEEKTKKDDETSKKQKNDADENNTITRIEPEIIDGDVEAVYDSEDADRLHLIKVGLYAYLNSSGVLYISSDNEKLKEYATPVKFAPSKEDYDMARELDPDGLPYMLGYKFANDNIKCIYYFTLDSYNDLVLMPTKGNIKILRFYNDNDIKLFTVMNSNNIVSVVSNDLQKNYKFVDNDNKFYLIGDTSGNNITLKETTKEYSINIYYYIKESLLGTLLVTSTGDAYLANVNSEDDLGALYNGTLSDFDIKLDSNKKTYKLDVSNVSLAFLYDGGNGGMDSYVLFTLADGTAKELHMFVDYNKEVVLKDHFSIESSKNVRTICLMYNFNRSALVPRFITR